MENHPKNEPIVRLVGAGPGAPDLLTIRALKAIEDCDVVVYDRLVSDEILALIPRGTARIDVGKRPGCHPVPQEEINALLANLALEGNRVVRLKGGDPYHFGRGGEEAAFLRERGVTCEAIPGVTSAAGCAAAAGIPLTHRGTASGVRFVTGHCRDDLDPDFDWRGLADADTTLVVYMGRANMQAIAVRLIANGLAAETPAAAICNGTRPDQSVTVSTLGEVARAVSEDDCDGPTLFIIGGVVDMVDKIAAGGGASIDDVEPRFAEAV